MAILMLDSFGNVCEGLGDLANDGFFEFDMKYKTKL